MPQKDKVNCHKKTKRIATKTQSLLLRCGKESNRASPRQAERSAVAAERKRVCDPERKRVRDSERKRVCDPLMSNTIKLSGNFFYYKYFLYFCPVERCLLFRQMLKVRRTTLTD